MAQNLVLNILAKDKTKQAFGTIRKRLGSLKNAVFSVQGALVGLGAGLVVRNLITTGKELENLRVRLRFLLKDTNEGAKAFDNMVKFASKVPFSLEEIQKGSGILATVTDNADDLQQMLEITGNVAAVTGLDFRTTAEQIQRSFSAGIGAADLFREKGVRNMLGFKAGATVSIEETVKAFEKVFGKGGRFGNSTDELAKTFEGTLSMIGDKVFNFKKVLLEAGFFEELKRQFGDLDKFLADNAKKLDEIATSVGKNLAQAVSGAVSVGQDLIPTLQKIGSVLKSIKDGFMALPEFAREVGLVGAFLFGKKGAVALAGVSFIIDKINDFVKETKAEVGIFDIDNIDEVRNQIDIINKQLESQGKIITKTITLNNGVTHTYEEQIDLGEETLKQLKKLKAEYETILILNGKGSVNQFELNRAIGESVKTQKKVKEETQKTFNIFESHHQLVEAVEKAEKRRLNRLIGANRNIFDEQQKLIPRVKEELTIREEVLDKIKEQNENFSISNEIVSSINKGVSGMSKSFAEMLVFGKQLNMTMKELAQNILAEIIAKIMERILLKQIEKILDQLQVDKEVQKDNLIKKQNSNLKKQIALQLFLNAIGGGGGGGIPFFAKGGAVSKGQPVVVGERGPELFVPNQTGQITQNARGTGGGSVNVNFNIEAIDSSSFNNVLVENRGIITSIINNALNEKGRRELV